MTTIDPQDNAHRRNHGAYVVIDFTCDANLLIIQVRDSHADARKQIGEGNGSLHVLNIGRFMVEDAIWASEASAAFFAAD